MKYIDLHVHSNASDGTFTPTEVVKRGIENNLAAFALTDHDTTSGIAEAITASEAYKSEILVIPGVELSVGYKNRDIHILGHFIDHNNRELCSALENARDNREQRNVKMAKKLSDAGIDITVEKLRETEGNAVLTRAHFAKYLTGNGYTKTNEDAFKKYLNANTPYYVPREYLPPEKAIELISTAGGIPVLAHPLLYKFNTSELITLIKSLRDMGLVGIEAIYSTNVNNEESYLISLARKYKLLVTGGSDFHGNNKPLIDMGVGKGNLKVPFRLLEELDRYRALI